MFYGSQSFGTSKYGGKNEVSVLLFVSISDGLTIAENLTGELKSLISIFDGLIIVENLTEELKFFVNIENQITIEESVIKFLQLGNIVAYDELTIIESPNIDLLNLINKNEILTITEDTTRENFRFSPSIKIPIGIKKVGL